MTTTRLIYFSKLTLDRAKAPVFKQLSDILDASNRNNEAKGITGMLVFDTNSFVEVLEGALDNVWPAFRKIQRDDRHAIVGCVEIVTVPSRRFGDWWMGCAENAEANATVFAPYLYHGEFQPPYMTCFVDNLSAPKAA